MYRGRQEKKKSLNELNQSPLLREVSHFAQCCPSLSTVQFFNFPNQKAFPARESAILSFPGSLAFSSAPLAALYADPL